MRTAAVRVLPDRPASAERGRKERPSYRRRRLVLVAVLFILLVSAAAAANHGPLRAYYDARARVEQAKTRVAALEEQKAELQTELGRLTEASYLETLAREELGYARPGEELYIVSGPEQEAEAQAANSVAAGAGNDTAASRTGSEAGFFERLVRAFLDLF